MPTVSRSLLIDRLESPFRKGTDKSGLMLAFALAIWSAFIAVWWLAV